MDKILIIMFPGITFCVITAGVILYEASRYFNNIFM